jgi:bifunctional non-homologous end joining protein LigD
MLMRDQTVPVTFVVFDVLELDGEPTMGVPYRRRRDLLEGLDFYGGSEVGSRFDNGAALREVVVEHRLEGVVAKRLAQPYRPGERRWVKRKNPDWPRYATERESVIRAKSRAARGAASRA